MRNIRTILASSVVLAAGVLSALQFSPARAKPPEGISLLQTLAEWRYPDAAMPEGASMSDGGNPQVPSVKCQAVLTTPDPVEKVVAFYTEKLVTARPDGQTVPDAKAAESRTVSDQDDSRGRPVTVRVFVVNQPERSTTLVISRARDEALTHIAWSHYIRVNSRP